MWIAFWTLLAFLAMPSAASADVRARALPRPADHRPSEAHVAVDPGDPDNVLVVSRDETGGGHIGLQAWRSADAGRRFRRRPLVQGRLEGLPADASDPVALFSGGRPAPLFLAFRYGEVSWSTAIKLGDVDVIRSEYGPPLPSGPGEVLGGRAWHDKPWAAIDDRRRRAYVAWTIQQATQTGLERRLAVTAGPPDGPFAPPQIVAGDAVGAQVVVRPDGSVVLMWLQLDDVSPTRPPWARSIWATRSTNGGASWSSPQRVARLFEADDPPFPSLASDARGRLVACWQEARRRQRGRIACTRSRDGSTWSRKRYVTSPSGGARQPAVAGASNGRFWMFFYRFDTRRTRAEIWRSTDAGRRWRRRAVVARRPYGGQDWGFFGDYQGLAMSRRGVTAAFVLAKAARRPVREQEVIVARVTAP